MSINLPNPFDSHHLPQPRSFIEKKMADVSNVIRSRNKWIDKINNPTIVGKWAQELKSFGLNSRQFQYVIDELKYFAKLGNDQINISPVNGVWESDNLIDSKLKKDLIHDVKELENVPISQQDWHPGSNHQVLDLVHPSLYSYIEGVTKVTQKPIPLDLTIDSMTSFSKKTHTINQYNPKNNHDNSQDYSLSRKYQWLPSEVLIDNQGHAKITSYINNLNPLEFPNLYITLERIVSSFVPLFNKTLTDLMAFETKPPNIEMDQYKFKEPNPKPKYDLAGRRLQIIFKLANIELKPENPNYPGGSWHVEGMKNENIVATGIYYYDSDNVSESYLHFRQAIDEIFDYEQNDDEGVLRDYGLQDEDPLNEDLGCVETKKDRCICFPNIYQHWVAPFELIDKNRPGKRKILVFFLVDPDERILSTEYVAPQQISWCPSRCLTEDYLTLNEAKRYRLDLMKERKFFVQENNKEVFERPFSLCEH